MIDLTISEGNNTPAFQVLQNDFLMQLFQAGAVDVKTLLENTSYPFAAKVLEGIKRKEMQEQEAMQQYQQMAQQEVEKQQMTPQMQRVMNGTPGAQDGVVMRG